MNGNTEAHGRNGQSEMPRTAIVLKAGGESVRLCLLVLRSRLIIFGLECHRDAISLQAILPLSVDSKGAQKVHSLRTKPSPPGFGTLWYGSEFLMSASDRIKRRALKTLSTRKLLLIQRPLAVLRTGIDPENTRFFAQVLPKF